MHDAIVVGARCAGASTAMLLARRGLRVLLVDRATFPSDLPHGHFIHRHGPARLARWGLIEPILATNCPPVTAITTDFGDGLLTGRDLVVDGVAAGYAPRRDRLDAVLVDAAIEAGVEFREAFTVEGLCAEAGVVTGVRGRAAGGGATVEEHATVTIGADGRNSRVARLAGAPAYDVEGPLTCWFFAYWSGVAAEGLEVHVRDRSVVFGFPTNDGLFALFIGWPAERLHEVRRDIESNFMAAVDRTTSLGDRVRAGVRETRFAGATDVPNFLRRPFGNGFALVGDAGCHKDPYLALGICDAFRDAELLADAVLNGFSGADTFTDALSGYERVRNEATKPVDAQNREMARWLGPPPDDVLELRARLRGNAEATRRFYLASQGMVDDTSSLDGGRAALPGQLETSEGRSSIVIDGARSRFSSGSAMKSYIS